jgi:ubiquinol-cytochrome c reductase cytochrome c1 subunit
VKKTIAVAALLISLVAVGCSSDSATPAPTEPAAALESLAADASAAVEPTETEAPAAATEAPAAATEAPAAETEAPAAETEAPAAATEVPAESPA